MRPSAIPNAVINDGGQGPLLLQVPTGLPGLRRPAASAGSLLGHNRPGLRDTRDVTYLRAALADAVEMAGEIVIVSGLLVR